MLIHGNSFQYEFVRRQKHQPRQQAWRGLCPDCLFLCKRQHQPAGPEKMILRILHEHLLKRHAVNEKLFIDWKNMPPLSKNGIPKFWSESIFGDFLECRYAVHYICGGNKEQVVDFGKKLRAAFDEKSKCFLLDSRHLSFQIKEITEVERPEGNPSIKQFCCIINLRPNA